MSYLLVFLIIFDFAERYFNKKLSGESNSSEFCWLLAGFLGSWQSGTNVIPVSGWLFSGPLNDTGLGCEPTEGLFRLIPVVQSVAFSA